MKNLESRIEDLESQLIVLKLKLEALQESVFSDNPHSNITEFLDSPEVLQLPTILIRNCQPRTLIKDLADLYGTTPQAFLQLLPKHIRDTVKRTRLPNRSLRTTVDLPLHSLRSRSHS